MTDEVGRIILERLRQINQTLLKNYAKKEDTYRQFGKDVFSEIVVSKGENPQKTYENIYCHYILADDIIQDLNNRIMVGEQETLRLESELQRLKQKKAKQDEKMAIFVDKLNKHLEEKRDDDQEGKRRGNNTEN